MKARFRGPVLTLLLACAAIGQAFASVTASLDTSQIAAGDTVQLTLERNGQSSGQPDLTPLQKDFDILGTSSSTSIELVNGSTSEKTEVVLTLAPKLTGRLTIPSLDWDGERSQPLSLMVSGPDGGPNSGGAAAQPAPNVFIETSVSPQRPYVQAAVQLTVRLFTAETLYHADLELPENGDVVAKQVGSDANSEAYRNGRPYQVITRQYLLFPLHSGRLTLQGPVLDAELAVNQPRRAFGDPFGGGFFGGPLLRTVRPVRLHAHSLVLAVRPRPASAVGSYWLPAREVTLSATWSPAKLSAQAGDPVTLDLTLRATGLTAAQLPDLSSMLTLPRGLKDYPDQPKLNDSTQSGTLVGSREQTIALIADSAGRYVIPALTVSWWDTQSNQPRVATLAGRTLTILPALGSAPSAAPARPAHLAPGPARVASQHPPAAAAPGSPPESVPSRWQWISIGLAVVWLATLGGWLWSRNSRTGRVKAPQPRQPASPAHQHPPDPARERAAFRAACEANDAHAARAHLLAWASALWGSTPTGVNAIAARIGDGAIAELLRDLDRACYASGEWQGRPLATALAELPKQPGKAARGRDGLAPLYP